MRGKKHRASGLGSELRFLGFRSRRLERDSTQAGFHVLWSCTVRADEALPHSLVGSLHSDALGEP